MASTDKPASVSQVEYSSPPPTKDYFIVDVILRFLLFASSLVVVVVVATSKQTKLVPVQGIGFLSRTANFKDSPALM